MECSGYTEYAACSGCIACNGCTEYVGCSAYLSGWYEDRGRWTTCRRQPRSQLRNNDAVLKNAYSRHMITCLLRRTVSSVAAPA